MVLGAFVDAGQVADEADGAVGVEVVAAVVAVPFQRVQESEMRPRVIRWSLVIGGSSAARGRAGGLPGATPVPVAGLQPYRGR